MLGIIEKKMMMRCVAIAAMSMVMVSCSDNDDNGTGTPETPEKEYVIEVGEGMKLPENEFLTKVPAATEYDQSIVDALKAIDGVMDVKPFTLTHAYNPNTRQFFTKTAYFFNYKQVIDHNDPSKGWFKQQCILTVAGKDRPTVLLTEGYGLGSTEDYNNRLDYCTEPTLVGVLGANCLQVEHRYFGWSLPEGYTNKWNYLRAKQQSADLHTIVTAIKQSGIVGQGKWLATGVSKPGVTSTLYAYEYPGEMDAYVPFCAPFMLSMTETGSYNHILSADALGSRLEKVKAAFRAYCGNKTLQQEVVKLYIKANPNLSSDSEESVRLKVLRMLFDSHWGRMSYVHYSLWEPLIPQEGDSAEKFLTFILANERSSYEGEDNIDYQRRLDYVDDLEPSQSGDDILTRGMTRAADEEIRRWGPFDVQTFIELGAIIYTTDWVDDLLTAAEKAAISGANDPAQWGFNYDNGAYVRQVLDGIKQSDCHMMFVYGMQDPWTGNRIPDDRLGKNCQILYIENGRHNDAIDTWNASERNQLFQWLNQLGFLPNE